MIQLKTSGKVYLICPAHTATGGPELLHQLGNKLRKLGVEAYMHYLPAGHKDPVHPNYLHYQVPYARSIMNHEDNLVIFPEIWLGTVFNRLFKRTRKAIWWLSVDNYFKNLHKPKKSILSRFNAWLRGRAVIPDTPDLDVLLQHKEIIHLAQSFYALDFLRQKGFGNTAYLSDYLSPVFLAESAKVDLKIKKNQILCNPKKGFEFTQQLMAAAPDLNWVLLENLTPKQVAATLAQSKVYIDFGQHPGKDRFPREAAVMGCCIITGKRGSAAFEEDLPLPAGFKFEDKQEQIPSVISKISQCFVDFESQQSLFAPYIARIRDEERQFDADIKKLFQ